MIAALTSLLLAAQLAVDGGSVSNEAYQKQVDSGRHAAVTVPLTPMEALPRRLPVFAMRGAVLFPTASAPLLVGRPETVKLIGAVGKGGLLLALTTRDPAQPGPIAPANLYSIGCLARIVVIEQQPDGSLMVVLQGIRRVRAGAIQQEADWLTSAPAEMADTVALPAHGPSDLLKLYRNAMPMPPTATVATWNDWLNRVEASPLSDQTWAIGGNLGDEFPEQQKLLEMTDASARVRLLADKLNHLPR